MWMGALAETEIAQVKLVRLDLQAETLVLQRVGQAEFTATLHKRPRLWWNKQPLAVDKLAEYVGKRVVVRMRVEKGRKPIVRELADPTTWKWLESVRTGIVKGTLKSLEDDSITLEFGDKSRFTYRTTARTHWLKAGKPVPPSAFEVGTTVFVASRLLSNLDTVALAVSDRYQDAQQGRKRALPTVQGRVVHHDLQAKHLVVRTAAGDERTFVYDQQTEFVSGGKPIKPEQVKAGTTVTVHRRRNADGSEYARRVTLHPPQR